MSGGVIDFSDAWIGSTQGQVAPDIWRSWIRELRGEEVESREIWRYPHPSGHIDHSNSTIKAGLVKFEWSKLRGAVVLFYGLEMSGGRIELGRCDYTGAVVSLWNVHLEEDAVIDFTHNYTYLGSPVIIYSRRYGGLGEYVRLREDSRLLEISAAD